MVADAADVLLVGRIRSGDADAWQDCIRRFEGRLFAFVKSRLNNSAASEATGDPASPPLARSATRVLSNVGQLPG